MLGYLDGLLDRVRHAPTGIRPPVAQPFEAGLPPTTVAERGAPISELHTEGEPAATPRSELRPVESRETQRAAGITHARERPRLSAPPHGGEHSHDPTSAARGAAHPAGLPAAGPELVAPSRVAVAGDAVAGSQQSEGSSTRVPPLREAPRPNPVPEVSGQEDARDRAPVAQAGAQRLPGRVAGVATPSARREARGQEPEHGPASHGVVPTIEIHIGRIDVRAAPVAPADPTAARPRAAPPLSLDEYLTRGRA